jgi:hypothetical protein
MTTKYCTFIGFEAGADVTGGEGLVIIGDGIRTMPPGTRYVIGKTVFGKECNLAEIVDNYQKYSLSKIIKKGLK